MPLIFQSGVGTLNLFGSYASDAAFVTANGTAINGYAYYNTTSNTVRAYIGSAWINLQADPFSPNLIHNLSIAASVNVSTLTLTVAFKTAGGNDASASDPIVLCFRNATATTGSYSYVALTAAASIVVPSGTSIGTANAVASYLYLFAVNNGGAIVPGVSLSDSFDEGQLYSSTAVSGGTSSTTLYTTAALITKAIRYVGRIRISEAAAGTWASAPTEVTAFPFKTGTMGARAKISTNQTPGAGNQINFATVVDDPFSMITTGASWKATIQNPGWYRISCVTLTTAAAAGTLYIYKNGSVEVAISTTNTGNEVTGSAELRLVTGDTIDIRPDSGATFDSSSTGRFCQVFINRIGSY
jgi:hypothetical protein